MKMRRPLKQKGFINIPRRITMLLRDGLLDFGDYGFYNFLIQEVDFEKKRPTFGCIIKTNVELAIDSGCHPSTITKRLKKLYKYDLIEKTQNGLIKVKYYEKFTIKIAMKLADQEVADMQEDIAQTQSIIAESQAEIAKRQQYRQEKDSSFRYSPYKDSRLSNVEDVNPDDIPF